MPLPDSERVVHAVCSDAFEASSGECSLELYQGKNVSVSRLEVTPLPQQWRVLAATVQKLPGRKLERLSELGVGQLISTARNYRPREKPEGFILSVEEDGTPKNRAHAEIRGNISKGLSRQLVGIHLLHTPPDGFDAESIPRI